MVSREQFDAVVIGSGIGGSAAARALAQFGRKRVLVLEQHYTLGGMTHEFSRDGRYEFPTGLHYLSAEPGPFLDFMTDGRAQLAPLPDDFDILHFPGFDFGIPASAERFRARLKEHFPGEAHAIDQYFEKLGMARTGLGARNVFSSFPAPIRKLGFSIVERLFPSTYRSLRDQLSRSFRDPSLRAVMAARWELYGSPPASAAFGYHASVPMTYYLNGATHPVGGPKEISQIILEILGRYGVDLRPRQRVHQIIVERGRAAGVDVEDRATGRRYQVRASTVVSAVGVRNTYALLGDAVTPRRARALASLPAESSTLMLFLGLKSSPAAFGPRGENHWFMPDFDADSALSRPPGEGALYASFGSLNNPAARFHTVEVLQLIDPKYFDAWRGTAEDERPDEYRRLKDETTRRVIGRLDERWPGFAGTVAFAELATPLSFETYQDSARGAFYGLSATSERLRSPLAGCRTPVKGVVVAGQDAWGPGVIAALAGGLMAANAVLSPRQVGTMWRSIRSRDPVRDPATPWRGYLRVAGIESLTPTVRRIRLEPLAGGTLPFSFAAGQYVKIDLPVAVESIERSYSISSGPGERDFLEIAVKHEPEGLGSTFLHEELEAGMALRLSGPFGEFTCAPERDLAAGSLLLIAGGVGITPLMSVLATAADANHAGPVVLLAGFRTEEEIAFERELTALQDRLPGLDLSIFVTRPGARWPGRRGRIDLDALRPHVANVSRVHLCGPAAMMQDIIGLLTTLGVAREAIHTEAFVSERSKQTRRERAHAVALAAQNAGVDHFTIGVQDGDEVLPCQPGQTILDAANAAHVPFPQSCGEGACGTCRVRVLSGSYETDTRGMFSAEELAAGWRLACQTLPTEDVLITQ